jgi:DNA-3-methyladenine glycosylase I
MDRCPWCGEDELYQRYHDEEWGVPVHDDRKHFEFLVLEGAQAGLSWLTVLRKRQGYRAAYEGFDPEVVALFDEARVDRMLADPGIVRNGRKIVASIKNARLFLEIQREFGSFDSYLWGFAGGRPLVSGWESMSQIPCTSDLSDAVSKDLRKRGFGFVGSTIIYSHLEAVGVINDHLVSCFRYEDCRAMMK